MKKSLIYFSAIMLGVAGTTALASCDDNWEYPPMVVPEATIEANTTISDIKSEFFQAGANNYATQVGTKQDGSHYIIEGYVTTSDESGNYFKQIVIQDQTGAIQLDVDAYDLYLSYQPGQKIVLDVTGLYIGAYGRLMQIGAAPTSGYPARIAETAFAEYAQRDGLATTETQIEPELFTLADLSKTTPDSQTGLDWQNRYIKIEGVTFQNAGKQTLSTSGSNGVSQTFSNAEGSAILYTSGYSDFWDYYCPTGTGDVVGILSCYNQTWQIRLIDIEGLQGFDELVKAPSSGGDDAPDVPGVPGEDGVYSVAAAISLLNANANPGTVQVRGIISEITELSTQYGNATYEIKDNLTDGYSVTVYRGKWIDGAAFTSENQIQVGGTVVVEGELTLYGGKTPELNTGNKIISYTDPDGNSSGGGGNDNPADGKGSQDSPYTVEEVMAGATGTGVWVKGYIVGWVEGQKLEEGAHFDATNVTVASNILISSKPGATSLADAIPVQLPVGVARTALNLQNNPGNLGKEVLLKGDLERYFGTAGVKSVTDFVLDGQSSDSGNTGEIQTYTVAQALAMITSGSFSATQKVRVTGIISEITEISEQYGNATYIVKDALSDATGLTIFRGKYLDGASFTSQTQLVVGAKVVVEGTLQYYNNTTPEMNTGNVLISYEAPASNKRHK